ncbi:MAG TPA: hypothetical protein VII79_02990 [Candidatus Dormibacteraeota bacterium]
MAEPVVRVHARSRRWLEELVSPGGLFVSAIVILALFPVTSIIRDPDFWWHLRAGQLIVDHGALLGTDPFTYTVSSHAWTMHEWLSEVFFAVVQRAGGLGPIVLILSVVTWIGIVCILLRAALRAPNRFVLGLGVLLGVIAGYPIWGPRVQMVTFCFSALTLLLVERHLVRGGRAIWLLVPLFLVWSNLHSGFIIGLGFIAVVIVAELAGRRLGMPDNASSSRVRALIPVLVACAVVSMINPNGPGILLYAFQTQTSAAQQALILEWHSPDFHDWNVLPFGIMLVSLVALITVNRRLRARDAALVLVTAALALQSVRHIALFVAAATPVWINQADLLLRRRRGRAVQRRPGAMPPLRLRVLTFAALAVTLFAAFVAGRLVPAMRAQPGSLAYAQEFPVCATRWLATAPRPLNIFNQYGEGGFLSYQLSSRGDKVFVFGDAALMGDALLYRYAAVEAVQPSWESIIRSAGTDIVLFDTGTPLANVMAHSTRWVNVYHDPLSVAFVPVDKQSALNLPPAPASYPPGDPCSQLKVASSVNGGTQNP